MAVVDLGVINAAIDASAYTAAQKRSMRAAVKRGYALELADIVDIVNNGKTDEDSLNGILAHAVRGSWADFAEAINAKTELGIDALRIAVEELSGKVAVIETRGDEIDAKVTEIFDNLADLAGVLAVIETREGAVDIVVTEIVSNLNELANKVNELGTKVDGLGENVTKIVSDLTGLATVVTGLGTAMSELDAKVDAVDAKVDGAVSRINKNRIWTKVAAVGTGLSLVAVLAFGGVTVAKLNKIEKQNENLAQQVSEYSESVEELREAYTKVLKALGYTEEDINQMDKDTIYDILQNLIAKVNANTEAIDQIGNQVDENGSKIDDLENKVDEYHQGEDPNKDPNENHGIDLSIYAPEDVELIVRFAEVIGNAEIDRSNDKEKAEAVEYFCTMFGINPSEKDLLKQWFDNYYALDSSKLSAEDIRVAFEAEFGLGSTNSNDFEQGTSGFDDEKPSFGN